MKVVVNARTSSRCLAGVLVSGALLTSCGGGGIASNPPAAPPMIPQNAPGAAAPQPLGEANSQRSAQTVVIPPPPQCTPIVNVNPGTLLNHTRTARYIDVPKGDGDDEDGGRHDREHRDLKNIDGTGCDYTIYLGPKSKHARIDRASVHGGTHIQIVADGADDLRIRDTVIDGGVKAVPCNPDAPNFPCDGVWFTFGASGSIERSFVSNVATGVVIQGSHALVGETLITNTSFLGVNVISYPFPNPTMLANGTVEDTYINNAMNTGGGVAVQWGATGIVRRTTAVGRGDSLPLRTQFGFFFGHGHPIVTTDHDRAIHNQNGFGSYCAIGINSVADLTSHGDTAVNSTLVNFDVNNNPLGVNCP